MTGSRFEDPRSQSPGFVLWQVTLEWQRTMTRALTPLGLSHPQFVVLAVILLLTGQQDQVTQVEIARQARVDPQYASQLLRKLQAGGWVQRTIDPLDTRARLISLTPAGQDLATRAITVAEEVDARFFGDAAPALTQTLAPLLTAR